jgi:ceramidase
MRPNLSPMRLKLSRRWGIWSFLVLAAALATGGSQAPRTDLPTTYHHFADQRVWLGIPHFGDVASNLAFLLAGLCGLLFLSKEFSEKQFVDPIERWPYVFVFFGLVLTAVGSAYYHLAPDNARLVWDRLPMILVFMPFVAALIAERVNLKLGLWMLPVLTVVGLASVFYWHWTEAHGSGDLRFYAAVQVYAFLALFAAMPLAPRYTRGFDLLIVAGLYAVAKICEITDRQIFSVRQVVSGHTLKHLSAAAAGFWILRMLQKRQPIQNQLLR